jgi:hypothetical protein
MMRNENARAPGRAADRTLSVAAAAYRRPEAECGARFPAAAAGVFRGAYEVDAFVHQGRRYAPFPAGVHLRAQPDASVDDDFHIRAGRAHAGYNGKNVHGIPVSGKENAESLMLFKTGHCISPFSNVVTTPYDAPVFLDFLHHLF